MPKSLDDCRKSVLKQGKTEEESWKICTSKTGWVKSKDGWINKKTGETYKPHKTNESFTDFLVEYISKSTYLQIAYRSLPLHQGLMKRLGYYQEDIQAYHVTNSAYLKQMYKNQNKAKTHLSCFTRGGNELSKLPSSPNALLLLEGDSVIEGNTDIFTSPDGRGVRWVDIGYVKDNKHAKKLKFYVDGVLQRLFDRYQIKDNGKEVNVYKTDSIKLGNILFDYLIDKKPKEYQQLYRDYMEEIEHMLNTVGYKELNLYLKTASDMGYNEIVLTKWKILEIKSIDYDRIDIIKFCKDNKISYGGIFKARDFSKLKI